MYEYIYIFTVYPSLQETTSAPRAVSELMNEILCIHRHVLLYHM